MWACGLFVLSAEEAQPEWVALVEPKSNPAEWAHSTQKSHVGARDFDMMFLGQLF